MPGSPYTDSELRHIVARYPHATTQVIAAEIGRSVYGVRNLIQRHGIKRRAADKSRIYSGWSRQPKDRQIAT